MNAELRWDGLRCSLPAGMEPVILDRGFIRLAGPDQAAIDLRFGPEKGRFDPDRDGRRILKASGLGHEVLAPCREAWTRDLKGDLLRCDRLCVLRFCETSAVAAVLFSTPPRPALLKDMMTSLVWTMPDAWRSWRCYDLQFETPPHATLTKAVFRPGRFHLEFAAGRSGLIFDRLAPANVLLAKTPLHAWLRTFLQREHGRELFVTSVTDEQAEFGQQPTLARRILSWLPGSACLIRGMARHDLTHNKLLILTERGRPNPKPVFERLYSAYATTTIQD